MGLPAQQIRFCTSRDGTRIAYATCGLGLPLVWIPHWVHHLELDWDNPVWRPWLSVLTRRHTLVRYDWRGCGLSDRDGVAFSFEKCLEDLEAVVEAAGLDRFALFGMTGGGDLSVGYAVRHPTKVTHLILCGSKSRGKLVDAAPARREEAKARLKVIEMGWPNPNPAYGQFFTFLHLPDASPEQMRSYNELLRLTASPATAAGLIWAYWYFDVRKIAPRVRCPTLILHARQDAVIPFEEGRSLAALIQGARFVPLESRNHILLANEPAWQQFVDAIEEFLPSECVSSQSVDDLTARERDVLEFVAQGLSNGQISTRLAISEKTVRNHVSIILSKLGVSSRAQAVAFARDAGFGRRIGRSDRITKT